MKPVDSRLNFYIYTSPCESLYGYPKLSELDTLIIISFEITL